MLFRDWLYPFPMHGIAVVLIALILWPLKEWLRKRLNPVRASIMQALEPSPPQPATPTVGAPSFASSSLPR